MSTPIYPTENIESPVRPDSSPALVTPPGSLLETELTGAWKSNDSVVVRALGVDSDARARFWTFRLGPIGSLWSEELLVSDPKARAWRADGRRSFDVSIAGGSSLSSLLRCAKGLTLVGTEIINDSSGHGPKTSDSRIPEHDTSVAPGSIASPSERLVYELTVAWASTRKEVVHTSDGGPEPASWSAGPSKCTWFYWLTGVGTSRRWRAGWGEQHGHRWYASGSDLASLLAFANGEEFVSSTVHTPTAPLPEKGSDV